MTINQPPLQQTPVGALRFNTDSSKLEYYDGNQWVNVTSDSPQAQTGGTRGLILGGYEQPEGGVVNTIQYINIATTGNAQDFGDITGGIGYGNGTFSNRVRGIYLDTSPHNQYINLTSTGNTVSLGSAATNAARSGGANSTRGLYSYDNQTNTIEYFTIASAAVGVDFGDMATTYGNRGCMGASPTRWVAAGGANSPWGTLYTAIEYVNFMSQGNSADFGDLSVGSAGARGTGGNAVRGVYAGGYLGPGNGNSNRIEYITVATLGNALDFGDLSAVSENPAIITSSTRAVFAGGNSGLPSPNPNVLHTIDYHEIMTTGNTLDFGDFTNSDGIGNAGPMSTGHGGLG